MREVRITGLAVAFLVGALAAFPCVWGCAEEKAPAWQPRPLVHWEDISTTPVIEPEEGYVTLTDRPTKGLFPADMAVTRVAVEVPEDTPDARCPRLSPDPRNEYLVCNAAFDDLMAISEVFPIAQRDMGGARATPDQILAAFRALSARLGLIYAYNELSENRAEMIGTLYDAGRNEPIAVFRAQAESIPPPEGENAFEPVDLWETAAEALVRERFERIVYDCVREFIIHDEPPTIEDSTGWKPLLPPRPVEWPPRASSSMP